MYVCHSYSSYLYYEWQARNNPGGGPQEEDEKRLAVFQKKIKIVHCKVPRQDNGCDCGVYVVKFAKMIIDVMPRTTLDHLRDDLRSQLDEAAFTQTDVDSERQTILALIKR